MVTRRNTTLHRLKQLPPEIIGKRPSEHQWSIAEILRHTLANEIRYLQIAIDPTIKQHELSVRAQWVGNILFRLEQAPPATLEQIVQAFDEVQQTSVDLLLSITKEQLDAEAKAPWGEMVTVRYLIEDLFDHDQFHRGQVHFLITLLHGLPEFEPVPDGINFG